MSYAACHMDGMLTAMLTSMLQAHATCHIAVFASLHVSRSPVGDSDMMNLLAQFKTVAVETLLFLKHVHTIRVQVMH